MSTRAFECALARFDRSRLPSFTQEMWRDVTLFFAGSGRTRVSPQDIAAATTLDPADALALLDCMAIDGTVELFLTVHDGRQPAGPVVLTQHVRDGWPRFPIGTLEQRDARFGIHAVIGPTLLEQMKAWMPKPGEEPVFRGSDK